MALSTMAASEAVVRAEARQVAAARAVQPRVHLEVPREQSEVSRAQLAVRKQVLAHHSRRR
jgi:hypothetical protein